MAGSNTINSEGVKIFYVVIHGLISEGNCSITVDDFVCHRQSTISSLLLDSMPTKLVYFCHLLHDDSCWIRNERLFSVPPQVWSRRLLCERKMLLDKNTIKVTPTLPLNLTMRRQNMQ